MKFDFYFKQFLFGYKYLPYLGEFLIQFAFFTVNCVFMQNLYGACFKQVLYTTR